MITVENIMTSNPITVPLEINLDKVIGLMKKHHCRHLPVTDNDHLVGIISDRDVRLAMNSPIVHHQSNEDWQLLRTVKAKDCMTPNPLTVEPSVLAAKAAELMNHYKFGALPVVKDEKLVGIVTVGDILKSYIELTTNL